MVTDGASIHGQVTYKDDNECIMVNEKGTIEERSGDTYNQGEIIKRTKKATGKII